MATLPQASVQIDDQAGALAGGTDLLTVISCVEQNPDVTARMFASTKALLAKHGYSAGVDYAALHFEETGKPIIFIGVPTVTAGAINSVDSTHGGTSVVSVAAGAHGVLEEVNGIVTVVGGGTVGTDSITLSVSLDGGRTLMPLRLGTASSLALAYVGLVLSFAAGTLIAGGVVLRFRTTAPRWDQAGLTAARLALAAQQKQARSWLLVGDLAVTNDASNFVTELNAYETANTRFVFGRAQVRDQKYAVLSGTPTLTFAEVGTTGDTITRSSGSWLTDGFAVADNVTIAGTVSNNVTGPIAALSATVLTFGTTDLAPETIVAGVGLASVVTNELDSDWVTSLDRAFGSIDGQRRIDLAAGRGFKLSPITGWSFRRPAAWAASIREYQHDVQIPTWRKADGACDGWSLEDADGSTVEHDERSDGGLLAARFTCFRTYANGPKGAFIALSLTRATESSLLSRTHNMAVADVACSVAQAETENAIGQVLELNSDGTGTEASLVVLESRVNSALAMALLQRKSEGRRASDAQWSASRSDVLNVSAAELNGTLNLLLEGTLEKITTRVRVQTAG